MLYLKDKYTLLESGTRWLSDTPDVPSAFPESKYNRTYTYLMLQRKSDGKIFVHVNTHLDHTSATARDKQVAVLIAELERFSQYPVLVTGDFNCNKTSAVWKSMQDHGYVDSSLVADTAETGITFHNYGSSSSIIDFCFVTNDRLQVSYYKVITEAFNGMRPSDHNPLFVDVMLP
jgi:endonuclease/exonuclease/phosphatase family metal-dependent hydrolase